MESLTDASNWETIEVPEFSDPYGPSLFKSTFQLLANRTKYLYDRTGAASVVVDSSTFTNNLGIGDDDLQTALETIDALVIGTGLPAGASGNMLYYDGTAGAWVASDSVVYVGSLSVTTETEEMLRIEAGAVSNASMTVAASGQELGFFGVTPVTRPSFDRADYAAIDDIAILMEALNDLGIIEFTGSYPA